MKYVIANWKAHKNTQEIIDWFSIFSKNQIPEDVTVIIAPPFPYLQQVYEQAKKIPFVQVASQTLSPFKNGPYTGEVTAEMIAEFARFTIIGHSERRTLFHEEYNDLKERLRQAVAQGIEPIFCIRTAEDAIPEGIKIVAYEPLTAIGTHNTADLQDVLRVKQKIGDSYTFIYGGSIESSNVKDYFLHTDGVLVGGASLDPEAFFGIISNTVNL